MWTAISQRIMQLHTEVFNSLEHEQKKRESQTKEQDMFHLIFILLVYICFFLITEKKFQLSKILYKPAPIASLISPIPSFLPCLLAVYSLGSPVSPPNQQQPFPFQ